MALKYSTNGKSGAQGWFLHRITGTFLVFLLLTHFWIQHYDTTTASVVGQVVSGAPSGSGIEAQADKRVPLPTYSDDAQRAVDARRAIDPRFGNVGDPVTPYDVTMQRLADPVYSVLWKAFNLFFLAFALHHGFYGLNNVLTDYIRRPMLRAIAGALSWTLAFVLLIIGTYSVVTAGWGMEPPGASPTMDTGEHAPVPAAPPLTPQP